MTLVRRTSPRRSQQQPLDPEELIEFCHALAAVAVVTSSWHLGNRDFDDAAAGISPKSDRSLSAYCTKNVALMALVGGAGRTRS